MWIWRFVSKYIYTFEDNWWLPSIELWRQSVQVFSPFLCSWFILGMAKTGAQWQTCWPARVPVPHCITTWPPSFRSAVIWHNSELSPFLPRASCVYITPKAYLQNATINRMAQCYYSNLTAMRWCRTWAHCLSTDQEVPLKSVCWLAS